MTRSAGYYPLCADLNGRRCVVIGGGLIAQRKVTTLLGYGADVTVVSPAVTKRLAAYARQRKIRCVPRRFRPADVRGAWLVYASTDDQRINELVYRSATARRIFTNVVDQKPLCSFIAPAIFRRGPLSIVVSTGGASPSLAKQVRSDVARMIGADYVPMLRLLGGLRGIAKRQLPSYRDRKVYFDRLVRGRVFELVRAGKPAAARRAAMELLERSTRRNGAAA
ncbi:MAG: bifunctional precorrin-2 dehydrogenase/sirohydrochlorin ferrochelatase [Candidatus Omnitrophica bacterium]|nr:bifunctional precorrin-2 dehydrogenase/sirohydrochlorin ferrochelatase [Candidatus Omnitrophota bacterium]